MKKKKALFVFFSIFIAMVVPCCKKGDFGWGNKAPKADFTFTLKNEGEAPDTVIFVSKSTGATSLSWNFDNGTTSTISNPQAIYTVARVYNVTLVATNQYGSDSVTKQIAITSSKPTANFTFSLDNDGQVPCKVTFVNSSINGSSFKWYFSSTDTSSNTNEQRTYILPRTYSVKLVASNASGSDSITKQITIVPISKSVVAYLITPRDKPFNINYYNALKDAVTNLQIWYRDQMGNNKTFVTNPVIVDTLTGLHDSAWYNSNNGSISGTDPRFYGYYNTFYEMQQLLGSGFNISTYTYLVYVAAPGGGAGATGFCAMGDEDLKGLLGQNPENLNKNRWIGGGGHELGHAFGLPHPDNQNGQAIMWTGYVDYPHCILQQSDKDILNASPFFR